MSTNAKTPPSLTDLMMRFVSRPIEAAEIEAEAGALGEVEPHEVAVGFRADPRLAWNEGLAVLPALGLQDSKRLAAPAEWPAVVVRHEAVASQPFALANYPQRVRDLTALLQADDLTKLRPVGESRPASQSMGAWAAKQAQTQDGAASLLAAAVLRAAGDLNQADAMLQSLQSSIPDVLRTAYDNEVAALHWQNGQADQAVAIWDRLPETPAVLFNRGLAALFLKQTAKARENLKKAVALIPDTDGWHHLGSLYLALAEMRSE